MATRLAQTEIEWHRPYMYPKQDAAIFTPSRFSVIEASAQPLDCTVQTPSGPRRFGDLRVGDQIFTVDGSATLVTGVFPQGVRSVYRLTFADGATTRASGDHLWQVDHYRDGVKLLTTDRIAELTPAMRPAYRFPLVAPCQYPHQEVAIDPWLLGVLLGDGSLCGNALSVATADPEIVERVRTVIPSGYVVTRGGEYLWRIVAAHRGAGYEGRNIREKANGFEVSVGRQYVGRAKTIDAAIAMHETAVMSRYPVVPEVNLRRELRALGLLGLKHNEKFIPQSYLHNSPDVRIEILRGIMDTDGSAGRGNGAVLEQTSRQLATDVRELVWSLGGLCRLVEVPARQEGWKTSFRLNIRHQDVASFFWLPRKRAREKCSTSAPRKLVKIERIHDAEVQCIAVDHPSQLYLTDDYIVTHNTKSGKTHACAAWLTELWMAPEMEDPPPWYSTDGDRNFWWIAPVLAQSKMVMRRIKRGLPAGLFEENKQELTLTNVHNGNILWFKGADNPDLLYGEDVSGAVLDEFTRCFAAGTLIDTPEGRRAIETLVPGDAVYNAVGIGRVESITARETEDIAVITVEGCDIVSSVDHKYLTLRGWVEARDLEPTDHIVTTPEAVRLVRDGVQSTEGVAAFLRAQLLSEVEDDRPGNQGAGVFRGIERKQEPRSKAVLGSGHGTDAEDARGASGEELDVRPDCAGQGVQGIAPDRALSAAAGREWETATSSAGDVASSTGAGVLAGVYRPDRAESAGRIPDALQDRPRQLCSDDRDRDRRSFAQQPTGQGEGREEDRLPAFVRVDRVAIYKQGSAEFDGRCGADGAIRLYDLSVSGHPSFSVNRLLVHNCKEAAWHAIRSTLTATRGPARLIGNVKGRKNWGYRVARAAQAGRKNWEYHKITAYDAIQAGVLTEEDIEEARTSLPKDVFRELYMAEATEDGANPFGIREIAACCQEREPGEVAAWGWDLGRKVDWTVGIGLDQSGYISRFYRFKRDWPDTIRFIKNVTGDSAVACIDATGLGDPVVQIIQQTHNNFVPFLFNTRSRQEILQSLAMAISNALVSWPEIESLIGELESFEYEHTKLGVRYAVPEGLHDDTVMALALAYRALRDPSYTLLEAW